MVEYTKEQFIELYGDLPEELQRAMESERTVGTIERLSDQEALSDRQHRGFVKAVGDLLIGLVRPSEFKKELVAKAGIEEESAEKIDTTVQRFILYPVRETLSELYKEKIEIEGQRGGLETEREPGERDKYREAIEEE